MVEVASGGTRRASCFLMTLSKLPDATFSATAGSTENVAHGGRVPDSAAAGAEGGDRFSSANCLIDPGSCDIE
jgi:hypothetical protein